MTRPEGPTLLVVGAAIDSLGEAVAEAADDGPYSFTDIVTAGITPLEPGADGEAKAGDPTVYEDYKMDLRHIASIKQVLWEVKPDVLVCTAGVNTPVSITDTFADLVMEEAFHTNVIGVMALLRNFILAEGSGYWNGAVKKKFVAISSNSARIPRRKSLAYCASKAALSMALRVAARELADTGVAVWGYEPGLLAGTPMTQEAQAVWSGPLHRMRGVPVGGLDARLFAQFILHDVANASPALNGLLIPFDADEQ